MAAEALRWLDGVWTGALPVGRLPAGQRAHWQVRGAALAADAPVLALYGLPPPLAEPIGLLAEILGWRVVVRLCGGALPARLCLAMLPARTPAEPAPILAWSTDNILNELISGQAMSILEQPLSISRLELLLQHSGRTGAVA